jgi:4-diphosphocytidyl-2-C-methyl-D-erythritol kinase
MRERPSVIRERAHAKVNLVLQVGPARADGLHELCSLFASLELADELTIEPAERDEIVCAGVEGQNLATAAVERFRSVAAPELPPLRVEIEKRIPVAAGLGGGSADAAAVLRAANAIAGGRLDRAGLRALGAEIGADVPSQVEPRHALVTGAGENVEPVELPDAVLVLVPQSEGLATGAVYAEADRIGSTREQLDPKGLRALASSPLEHLAGRLENDLGPAALSLRPGLAEVAAALRESGALAAQVTGSGPTVFGLFAAGAEAERAAALCSDAIVTRLRQT